MRGDTFHNFLADEIKAAVSAPVTCVYTEYRVRRCGVVADFDLFLTAGHFVLGIEIETTIRHAFDNIRKADAVDVPLWVVVPTRRLKNRIERRLKNAEITPAGQPIKILLLDQVKPALTNCLSKFIQANMPCEK